MCFAPLRRALFEQLNFQKCSDTVVFLAFWLGNVLRTTAAWTMVCFYHFDFEICFTPQPHAHFQKLTCQKCSEPRVVLNILTSKSAPRPRCFAFFISHPTRWLRTYRFSEPTFRTSWRSHKTLEKQCFATFSTFSRILLFFLPTLSLLWSSFSVLSLLWLFPPLLLHLSIVSEVWLQKFLRSYHICIYIYI